MPSPNRIPTDKPGSGGVGGLILAAGASSRMGQPKQLLHFRGVSLLRHASQTALAGGLNPVVAVVGAHADPLRRELDGLPIRVVTNERWAGGIGTSIRAGVAALATEIDALLILLADQPLVTPDLLSRLVNEQRASGAAIVATAYHGTRGVPAVFARSLFRALGELPDASGAKLLIDQGGAAVREIAFPDAAFDVDTPADAARLNRSN